MENLLNSLETAYFIEQQYFRLAKCGYKHWPIIVIKLERLIQKATQAWNFGLLVKFAWLIKNCEM